MGRVIDLSGQTFSRLTVLERVPSRKYGETLWRCRCSCGNETITSTGALRSGLCRSCGCLHIESARAQGKASATHGLSKGGPLYSVWSNMKTRCYNRRNRNYARWGARGIYVCDEWKDDFKAFHDWGVANGYEKGLLLDRIDNDGPYSPENCRWATPRQQAQNTRKTRFLTWKGETKPMIEWCRQLGIPAPTLCYRLRNSSVEVALSTPVTKGGAVMRRAREAEGQ